MAKLNTHDPITSNGDYEFSKNEGRNFTFSASGDFSGGVITLKYIVKGTEVPFVDGVLNESGGFEVLSPSEDLRITLTGAATPSIDIVLVDTHDSKR